MRFFVLDQPEAAKARPVTEYLTAQPVHNGEAPRCPVCGGVTGLLPWLPPHRAELEIRSEGFGDIAFGSADELLVTDRFRACFEDAGLTGLREFHPVEVTRVKGPGAKRLAWAQYLCVALAPSRAAVDLGQSGIVIEGDAVCAECRQGGLIKRGNRVIIEANTWQGEDMFIARGLPGTVLTSERFKAFCDLNAITGAVLVEASRYAFDFYLWELEGGRQ